VVRDAGPALPALVAEVVKPVAAVAVITVPITESAPPVVRDAGPTLPVVVAEATVVKIWEAIEADPSIEIVVDMERLQVEVPSAGISSSFPMEPQNQHRFINGLDDVGITLTHVDAIDDYEANRPSWLTAR
jgi:hypothetical protein